MPFARPSLATLIDRAAGDIETRLPGADARLRRSNLNVLARVHAGATHGQYGFLDWIARQALPDTAEAEVLERHASIWKVVRVPAAFATGQATATGTNGTVVPAGTVFRRADGAEFATDAEATVAAGSAALTLVASEAGQDGNTASAATLTLVTPIAGLGATVSVGGDGLTGGADIESDEALRARLLARIQQPPHGGARHDYIAWIKEIPGVTRAWCYPQELGTGTVTVRFVRDGDASIIPDAAEVAAAQAYVDALRPVTAALTVVAPVAVAMDFQIRLTPNGASVQAAVEAELRDLLLREAELRDLLLREAEPGVTILYSHLREAISLAAGETDHDLVAPAANVAHGVGEMATFGSITWLP